MRIVLVGVMAAIAALLTACGDGSEPGARADMQMTTRDNSFEPAVLELGAGEEVTLEVANEGELPHDFSIESLEVDTGVVKPGESATVSFEVPEGSTEFVCTFHAEMKGRIEANSKGA